MKEKRPEHEAYFTFNRFSESFRTTKKGERPDIDKLWMEVKRYFLSFEEWFRNKHCYHLVGFLVDCGASIGLLKKEAEKITKSAFIDFLKKEIRKQVSCDIDELILCYSPNFRQVYK
ncbi:hypothetical protein HF329_33275 [Chitinophaga oryzae]|uniref:Uncharacterized protein n=1 Tax=Chitinophaga oryzae TaxID=2725414 RepID=A0AAE6ZNM8_9BACT|nr:hypothetical protein [Chitinophaga oryzae]QJB35922.1 hypothetical protein HF329_33275 [Chitinophaga oryzae]